MRKLLLTIEKDSTFKVHCFESCFGFHNKTRTMVTSVVEGELSEPEELILDSSSADMDFPLRLYTEGNKI